MLCLFVLPVRVLCTVQCKRVGRKWRSCTCMYSSDETKLCSITEVRRKLRQSAVVVRKSSAVCREHPSGYRDEPYIAEDVCSGTNLCRKLQETCRSGMDVCYNLQETCCSVTEVCCKMQETSVRLRKLQPKDASIVDIVRYTASTVLPQVLLTINS